MFLTRDGLSQGPGLKIKLKLEKATFGNFLNSNLSVEVPTALSPGPYQCPQSVNINESCSPRAEIRAPYSWGWLRLMKNVENESSGEFETKTMSM